MYPNIFNETMNFFKKCPGVGDKSAERMALSLLDMDTEELEKFGSDIANIKKTIHACQICGYLTDQDECYICKDKTRNNNLICVVEDFRSAVTIEKTGTFNGKYHILNNLISPMNGINPDDINIGDLFKRLETLENPEIIFALKSTIEGDTTTLYITKKLADKNVTISRLPYGIPMGAEIDYLDVMTLSRAMDDRIKIS